MEVPGTLSATVVEAVTTAWEGSSASSRGVVRRSSASGIAIFATFGEGFQAAVGVIHGIWNAFARFWNSIELTLPAVDIPGIGRVGGFTIGLPDLPTFASGGIVISLRSASSGRPVRRRSCRSTGSPPAGT